MNTIIVVQARMGSTRLPGKVMGEIGGMPSIGHTIWRCRLTDYDAVCAIPDTKENDILWHYLTSNNITVVRGPEQDVLKRYLLASTGYDIVVRVTGDCPFIDPGVIKQVAHMAESHPIVTTDHVIHGLDCEAYQRQYLITMDRLCKDNVLREGMTFARRGAKVCPPEAYDHHSGYRWVLDTPKDLEYFRWVASKTDVVPPHPTIQELKAL